MNAIPQPLLFNESTIHALGLAVRKTFKNMAGGEVVMLPPLVKTRIDSLGDVSGIMNLVHPLSGGSIILSFPKETIFYILARIYKVSMQNIDACVQDGVGELVNVVYGQFRILNGPVAGVPVPTAPFVITGDSHRIKGNKRSETLIMPFRIEQHTFHVYLQLNGTDTNGK